VLVAPLSPSRTRSPEPQVVGEAFEDDARTTTPPRGIVEGVVTSPPVADTRAGSPPQTAEGVGTSAGDVRATTSPKIIDVDPIGTVPGGAEYMVGDQPQVDLPPRVQKHLAHRYLHLHLQAQGCCGDRLIGITPLGRRIGSKITRTCKPCGPA
jgi:hypothetical protein